MPADSKSILLKKHIEGLTEEDDQADTGYNPMNGREGGETEDIAADRKSDPCDHRCVQSSFHTVLRDLTPVNRFVSFCLPCENDVPVYSILNEIAEES